MSDDAISHEAVATLAAKLQGLELTAEERDVLHAVVGRAVGADGDVEGFGVVFEIETTVVGSGQPRLKDTFEKEEWMYAVGRAAGLDPAKLGVWTDMRP